MALAAASEPDWRAPCAFTSVAAAAWTGVPAGAALEAEDGALEPFGDEADVLATLESFDLIPANMNASGQIVAAGTVENLQKLADNAPEKARLRPLAVAGAFHTEFMAPAQEAVAAAAQTITPRDPQLTLLSNRDGKPVTSGAEALAAIVAQVTRPVRWDLCTATMREAEVSMVVELPPAGALVGIAKRELQGVPQVAVKTPADLTELLAPAQ